MLHDVVRASIDLEHLHWSDWLIISFLHYRYELVQLWHQKVLALSDPEVLSLNQPPL